MPPRSPPGKGFKRPQHHRPFWNDKENADSILAWLKVASITGLSIGVLAVVGYCASIRFFPSGVSISDGLLFFYALLILGWGYFFLLAAMAFPIFCVVLVKREFGLDTLERVLLLLMGAGLLIADISILISAFIAAHAQSGKGLSLNQLSLIALALGMSGFLTGYVAPEIVASSKLNLRLKRRYVVTVLVVAVLLPLIIFNVNEPLLNWTFATGGLRTEVGDIKLDEVSSRSVLAAARISDNPILTCSFADALVVENVRLLWHGIGDTSLIQLKDEYDRGTVTVEVKRDAVQRILTSARHPTVTLCVAADQWGSASEAANESALHADGSFPPDFGYLDRYLNAGWNLNSISIAQVDASVEHAAKAVALQVMLRKKFPKKSVALVYVESQAKGGTQNGLGRHLQVEFSLSRPLENFSEATVDSRHTRPSLSDQ